MASEYKTEVECLGQHHHENLVKLIGYCSESKKSSLSMNSCQKEAWRITYLKKFHAKLSDFGLARKGPVGDGTHVSTRVVGTMGYAAPEYVASGHLTSKSNVYSFGVVRLGKAISK